MPPSTSPADGLPCLNWTISRGLQGELQRLRPAEILISEDFPYQDVLDGYTGIRRQGPWLFESDTARRVITQQLQVRDLTGFGCEDLTLAICAAGCLLQYAKETQRTALPHIRKLSRERREEAVILDATSRRNLEIDTNLMGGAQHTLAWVMDRTATAMGGRQLRRCLTGPYGTLPWWNNASRRFQHFWTAFTMSRFMTC